MGPKLSSFPEGTFHTLFVIYVITNTFFFFFFSKDKLEKAAKEMSAKTGGEIM